MTDSPIQHVSDTARWVAFYRAMESARPDAVFRDPYARRLAGQQGEDIVNTMKDGRSWAWPMVVRTAVIDEIILRLVRDQGRRMRGAWLFDILRLFQSWRKREEMKRFAGLALLERT